MLKNSKTDIKNNIFKQDIIDPECCLLNKWKRTFGTHFYEKASTSIVKYYQDENNFATEIILHQYLSNKKITTDFKFNLENKQLSYILDDKISLYNYLETCNESDGLLRVLLNELFAFVNKFKKYNFVHGNLHIANIFVNPKTLKLYTIDFTHSCFLSKQDTSVQQDLNSLYKSLKKYFTQKRDNKSLLYLDSLKKTF